MAPERDIVMRMTDGMRFLAGRRKYTMPSLRVERGEWVAFVPAEVDPEVDSAAPLARVFNTIDDPLEGTMELLGQNVARLEYAGRLHLRSRIGFVHGYGGLLSSRNLYDNLALPVSVHGAMSLRDESKLVRETIERFALEQFSLMLPHEMDGASRWRACLARALILSPDWVVLEGLGNWEADRGEGVGWTRLLEVHLSGRSSIAICLPRRNAGFLSWFEEHGGRIVRYTDTSSKTRSEHR